MSNSTPTQFHFAPFDGFCELVLRTIPAYPISIRADFNAGSLSFDLDPLLLRGIDQQIGLPEYLSAALGNRRHASLGHAPHR